MQNERQERYDVPIKVVGKVGLIVDAFRQLGAELHLQQIATATGLELPTASRLVNSLVGIGLLRYDPVQRLYTPGLIFLELSRMVLNRFSFRELAHREMIALARETGWQCYLAIPDEETGRHIIYIDAVAASPDSLERSNIGQRRPMHSTSTGKVLLAYRNMPLDSFDLEPRTPFTHTDPERLRAELLTVRDLGYAVSINEEELDFCSAAAPILDADGQAVAAFGASSSEAEWATASQRLIGTVMEKASGITSAMRLAPGSAMLAHQ